MLDLFRSFDLAPHTVSDRRISPFELYDRAFKNTWEEVNSYFAESLPYSRASEIDGNYVVSLDVPGVADEDLKMKVSDRTVYIEAVRKSANSERKIEKTFFVPKEYDPLSAQARLDKGVLTLSFLKVEQREVEKEIPLLK